MAKTQVNRERITLTSPDQVNTEHYQLMPDAEEDRFNGLVEDIRKKGIENPLILDVDYNVIDGNTRVQVWRKIVSDGGEIPPVPALIGTDLDTELEKRTEARRRNVLQRPLGFKERESIAREQIEEVTHTEEDGTVVSWSQTRIAKVARVDDSVVKRLRETLEGRKKKPLPRATVFVSEPGERYPHGQRFDRDKQSKGITEARQSQGSGDPGPGTNGQSTTTFTQEETQDLVNMAVQAATNTLAPASAELGEDEAGETPAIEKLQEAGIIIPTYPSGKTPAEQVKDAAHNLQDLVNSLEVSPEDAARSLDSTPIEAMGELKYYRELVQWLTRFADELQTIADRREVTA